VADAVEAAGQHMDEEAEDELGGRERHRLEARAPVEAVVIPPEGDAVALGRVTCVARQAGGSSSGLSFLAVSGVRRSSGLMTSRIVLVATRV
jgi:hypothetical protein